MKNFTLKSIKHFKLHLFKLIFGLRENGTKYELLFIIEYKTL